jgi:hypothetical protein
LSQAKTTRRRRSIFPSSRISDADNFFFGVAELVNTTDLNEFRGSKNPTRAGLPAEFDLTLLGLSRVAADEINP